MSIESPGRKANTFTDILLTRAETLSDRRAYTFLRDGEEEEASLTFGELHRRALAIAERLMSMGKPGDRAVLLYPAGLEFIASFFGCLYAGIVPVPASVPNRKRGLEIVRGIVIDSGARWILSSGSLLAKFDEVLVADPGLRLLERCNTEEWVQASAGVVPVQSQPGDIALLQYTSGSTGTPRGVVVTHANLVSNHREHERCFGHDDSTVAVSWLPMFHDMGLGTVLGALWLGVPCVLMAPTAFLQKPVRWLRAISRYRATSSGGPDFAYDLCVRRIAKEECQGLDLSSWRVAYNGSEPVHLATLSRFTEAFAPYGFRQAAFHPVYGLAEATLFVSGEDVSEAPVVRRFSREALERGEGNADTNGNGQPLVSCGAPWLNGGVKIVNPESRQPCGTGQIGEIWVSGPSVAAGYWKKPKETAETFEARTADGEGPFLRTGDLGFLHEGRLFVAGRSKDLIIVRGRNHYPQDIEISVSGSHPSIEPLACAAFSVDSDDGEQLVVAAEVKRTAVHHLTAEAVFLAIRSVVSDRHGLHTHAVVLLSPGTLPRTTSGKVRRKTCKQAFLKQSLAVLAASVFGAEAVEVSVEANGGSDVKPGASREAAVGLPRAAALPAAEAADKLVEWLRQYKERSDEPRTGEALRAMSPSVMLDFAKQGLLGLQVSAEYGGLGLGHSETVRVLDQLAAIDLNAGLFVGLNNYLGVGPIAAHAQPKLKEALLPRLARGGELAGFAFAEPGVGSNPEALASYAEPINGSGFRLFGDKHVSGGAERGVTSVFVRHADREGLTAFVVPNDAQNLERVGEALARRDQGLPGSRLSMAGVALKNDHVLGTPGKGMAIALDAMGHARLAVAAVCVGAMKRSAQLVFHYATQRHLSTGRLVAHPVTLSKLGRVTAGVTALECLVQQIARAIDAGRSVPAEAFTVCKVAAPEMLWEAVDDLVQLLGRRGNVETPHVRNLVRDAQALRSCEGPTEAISALLGARLMNDGEASIIELATEILGAPGVGPLIGQAMAAVRAREMKAFAGTPRHATYWAQARAGELSTWLTLLAAVEGRRQQGTNGDLDRASIWARTNFERTLTAFQSEPYGDANDGEGITESVAAYSRSIGDVNPLLMWDEQALQAPMARSPERRGPGADSLAPQLAENARSSVEIKRPAPVGSVPPGRPGQELQAWLVVWLAQRLRMAESQIDPRRSFADHGLDSLAAVQLAAALSERLGRTLDETLLWNFANIEALVEHLESTSAAPPSQRAPAQAAQQGSGAAEASRAAEAGEADLEDEIARLERELKER